MNSFDLVLIAICLISLLHGYLKGFLGSLTGIPLLISTIYISSLIAPNFKEWLNFYEARPEIKNFAFPILVILCMIAFRMLANLIQLLLKKYDHAWIDQILGLIWGVVRAFAVIKLSAMALNYAAMHKLIDESTIFTIFKTLFTSLDTKFW